MVDEEATEEIARERLAESLAAEAVPYASDLALLEQHLRRIRRALLNGETPRSEDLTTAYIALDELEERLADVESMFYPETPVSPDSDHCRVGQDE